MFDAGPPGAKFQRPLLPFEYLLDKTFELETISDTLSSANPSIVHHS